MLVLILYARARRQTKCLNCFDSFLHQSQFVLNNDGESGLVEEVDENNSKKTQRYAHKRLFIISYSHLRKFNILASATAIWFDI